MKKGNPKGFVWTDLTNAKIGIVDGWAYDEHCIAREKDRITVSIGLVSGECIDPFQINCALFGRLIHVFFFFISFSLFFFFRKSWFSTDKPGFRLKTKFLNRETKFFKKLCFMKQYKC